jgi:hypothetical protein
VDADNDDFASAINWLTQGIVANPMDMDILINRASFFLCIGAISLRIC